jgi:hypothetical protein
MADILEEGIFLVSFRLLQEMTQFCVLLFLNGQSHGSGCRGSKVTSTGTVSLWSTAAREVYGNLSYEYIRVSTLSMFHLPMGNQDSSKPTRMASVANVPFPCWWETPELDWFFPCWWWNPGPCAF